MRSKSWLVALTLAVIASPASAATLFSDDVESGVGGWTATGLWHRVAAADACTNAHGGSASWYYGQAGTCTYDNGAANSGTLTSAAFAVPLGAVTSLSFWSYYQTEETGTSWDVRIVQVSVDGGAFQNVAQLSGDTMFAWRLVTVDLSAYTGHTIQLRFYFDTYDAVMNAYRGWYVDDVRVTGTGGSYASSTPTSSWIDIVSPSNDIGMACDDCQATRSIGFPFVFYGPTYSSVNISSNGYVTFAGNANAYSNTDIPNSSLPNAFAAPFWDDLYVSGAARVYAATVGSAPNRRFVVTWQAVDYCCSIGSGPLTFQLVLNEADMSIVFQYASIASTTDHNRGLGNSATVGLENQAGSFGVRYSYDTASLSDGLAIRFLPEDTDGDGPPDFWEALYGTDQGSAASPVLTQDIDSDGLNWLQEYHAGTNPSAADTDGDGVSDGEEVAIGTNPVVSDGPAVTLTLSGPGTLHGTAYYRFTTSGSMTGTTGFRVYYGPRSGAIAADYPAHFDLTDATARSGYIDQQWGMQGVPMVYFRIAPTSVVAGRVFVGTLSNEHAAFFAEKSTLLESNAGTTTTTTRSSSGCSAGGAGMFGFLLAAAALPLRRLRRRGAPAA
jgi:hypothetical protein